jgi:hypothetical protein
LNGHAGAKPQLIKEGIAFESLDNGFAPCADPPRFQAIGHHLTAAAIQAFFDRWVDQLPWPLSPAERDAGYQHDLSVWQLEMSRTQVFADREQGRALVEELIRANLDRGRPEWVRVIFERQVPKRTPRAFPTQGIPHGVIPRSTIHDNHRARKQSLTEERAVRTEMLLNTPRDVDQKRGIAHVADRVALGQRFNDRLLEHDQVPHDGLVSLETVRRLGQSTRDEPGHRASA